ncbi:PD-(D/E)XK nuclease family protein [bacterium]|nr:PD-(D/E)XK nuclease family protein [bacterium]
MTIYSHSRLETFKSCPLKYKFNYIDKIKREEEGIEAFLGSRFHEVMEKIYKDLPFRKYSLDELLDFYEDDWDKNFHNKIVIADNEREAKDYKEIGKKFIEDYYKRYYPFNQGKVLGIERQVIIDLDDKGEYKLRGYIDRLDQTKDRTYEIHDYKTSKSLPEQSKMDEDRQLALYQIGIQNMWNDVYNVELVWHYVAFDKEIRSSRTEEELDELKKDTIDLIKKIEATREFLPNESTLCGWCYYKDICPLYKHEYMVGNLPANKYLKDSGVKLVNEFAKLDDKKKGYKVKIEEIDEELEKIKEAVIQYAGNIGVEVVIGSDHRLKITSSEKINVPGKGTKERESLIELLSQLNRLEEVSAFDVAELKKVIKEEKWDSDILDEIKKFVEIETVKSVHLSKSKRED